MYSLPSMPAQDVDKLEASPLAGCQPEALPVGIYWGR
jgi:hypothetical protein